MKKIIFLILLLFPLFADAKSRSTIVMDIGSGRVLYAENESEKKLIASTTKIMTCIIVLDNCELNQIVTVGNEVLESYGTNIYLEPGEKMKVIDLLYGLMLRSGNDAALTLAVQLFGNEDAFVLKMNNKARELGMINTTFENCHGLDDDTKNYSTAYDMAILSQYAYQNAIYRKIISTKKYSTKSSTKSYLWYNRVSLLNDYSNCIGGKNGYTPNAGKTLVSIAKKDDLILTVVSLNDPEIYDHHHKLYDFLFSEFHNYTIFDKNHFSVSSSFFSNKKVYIKESFIYPFKDDELERIETLVQIYPSSNKNVVGEINVFLEKKLIHKTYIYEKKQKKEDRKSIFQWFQKLFI